MCATLDILGMTGMTRKPERPENWNDQNDCRMVAGPILYIGGTLSVAPKEKEIQTLISNN